MFAFGFVLLISIAWLGILILLSDEYLVKTLIFGGVVVVGLFLRPNLLLGALVISLIGASSFIWADVFRDVRFVLLGVFLIRALIELTAKKTSFSHLPKPFLIPLVMFVIYSFISTFYSVDPSLTFQRSLTWVVMIFALGVYLWTYMTSQEKLESMITIIINVVMLVVIVSLIAWSLGVSEVVHRHGFQGLIINPNGLGGLLALTTLPLFWKLQKTGNPLYAIVFLGFVVTLILAQSQNSGLTVIVSFAVYFALISGHRALMLLVPVVVAAIVVFQISNPISGALETSGRLDAWSITVDLIGAHPFLGHGFGSTESFFPNYFLPTNIFKSDNPSNAYLEMLLESGIIGLVLILIPLMLALAKGFILVRTYPDRRLIAMITAVVVGSLVHNMFESWMMSVGSMLAIPFWFFVLLIFKCDSLNLQSQQVSQEGKPLVAGHSTTTYQPGSAGLGG